MGTLGLLILIEVLCMEWRDMLIQEVRTYIRVETWGFKQRLHTWEAGHLRGQTSNMGLCSVGIQTLLSWLTWRPSTNDLTAQSFSSWWKKKWSLLGLEKLLSSKWALTAFLEVLGLNPNIYMVTVTTICNSSSRGSEVLLWQPVYQTSRWCIHTHNRKYIFKDHYASIFGSKIFDIRLFDSGFSLPFLFLNFYVHLRWPCTR